MQNKVVVTIADRDYTMVAVEDENYVRKCAAHVDQQLREIANSRISQADAAVRGDDDEPVFGARHNDIRHGVRVVELARGGPVVRVEDRG